MIGYLRGKLLSLDEHVVLLDVAGVGYEIWVGSAREVVPESVGEELTFWIHTHVREDTLSLFGFRQAVSKKIFQVLLGVNGIGPKLALAVVSGLDAGDLLDAVVTGNVKLLTSISGVGKKMAERMILELKDKLALAVEGHEIAAASDSAAELTRWRDLADALAGLGFPDQKIRNVIKLAKSEFQGKTLEINDLLKFSLQKIKNC